MIVVGYVQRWLIIVCRPKVMREGHVKRQLTMCVGQRRRIKATDDVG